MIQAKSGLVACRCKLVVVDESGIGHADPALIKRLVLLLLAVLL